MRNPVNSEYVLGVGNDGAERLESVQLLYGNESKLVLQKSGLKIGMTVLDAGCGTGLMTQWLSKEVGSSGQVIALDNSQQQIDFARKHLEKNHIGNVNYVCKNVDELSYNDLLPIDLFYARLLLVHNKNPALLLNNIKNNCKKNTIFVFEEPITSESDCHPYDETFYKHLELYCRLGENAGFDYDFGKELPTLIANAGLKIQGIRTVKNYFSSYQAKLIAYQRTTECAKKYIQHNMIEEHELEDLQKQLLELANNQTTLLSGVTMLQVWGTV